ncbi:MAG: hypothetical protein KA371_08485 [Acidobacteria bacterium]|nr:hypothetical protein [Acidobacteriota bacterium]
MTFDLRLPVGLLFTLLGLLLTGFGLVSPAEIYRRSLGINVNLIWGAVVLLFGAVMLVAALLARRRAAGPSRE